MILEMDPNICGSGELDSLASYICAEPECVSALLSQLDAHSGSFDKIPPEFLRRAQTRAVIRIAISIHHEELSGLLKSYEADLSNSGTVWRPRSRVSLSLLHRLVDLMVFQEQYVIRDCSLLLKTHDDVVKTIILEIQALGYSHSLP